MENIEAQADVHDEVVGSGPCQILGNQQPGHCSILVPHHLSGEIIYQLKTCPDPGDTYCPGQYTTDFLGTRPVDMRWDETVQVPILPLLEQFWRDLARATVSDYVNCATRRGDDWTTACAWAVGSIVVPYGVGRAARSIMALRVALRTGIGIDEAMVAVRATEIDAAALAQFEEEAALLSGCLRHSFDAHTPVIMADGRNVPIGRIKVGDSVRATDPISGRTHARTVSRLWRNHDTELTDITIANADGRRSVIHTTTHHPFWDDTRHQWIKATELGVGTYLYDHSSTVVAVRDFVGAQDMYDLTVQGTHTYTVLAGKASALVHNASCGVLSSAASSTTNQQAIDGLASGDGLSGIFEPLTGRFEARLSGDAEGATLPRRGGHGILNRRVFDDSRTTVGFTAVVQSDGSLNVTWLSRSVTGEITPPAMASPAPGNRHRSSMH